MFTVSVVPALSPFLQTLEEAIGDKPRPHTAQSACKDKTSTSRRRELSQPQCPPAGGKLSWCSLQPGSELRFQPRHFCISGEYEDSPSPPQKKCFLFKCIFTDHFGTKYTQACWVPYPPAALHNTLGDLPATKQSGAWKLHPDATSQAACKSPSPATGCYGALLVARNSSPSGVVSGGKHSLRP